jgi:protein involved in polysaccharide export with SLBB domain
MKKLSLALALLFTAAASAEAQTQVRERRLSAGDQAPATQQPAARNRVVGDSNQSNHSTNSQAVPVTTGSVTPQEKLKPAWGDASVPVKSQSGMQLLPPANNRPAQSKLVKPTSFAVNNPPVNTNARTPVPEPAPAATNTVAGTMYRIGIGDVLDIRLANVVTRESTLFTVLKDGGVEYPLLSGPMVVAGLTTDEIARRLSTEIKVIKDARIVVSVRDFASHSVMITGLVDNPGRKTLRREVMPLYALLAEALARPEATSVTLVRNNRETNLSVSNNQDMATLVMSGDTIKVSAAPKQFVYLGGDVVSGGEKEFREGMTLTQAIMTAGGARDAKSRVRIARRGANGLLASQDYSLPAIVDGKAPDPLLQPGDRIELQRGVW